MVSAVTPWSATKDLRYQPWDIRVGQSPKSGEHPEADKLYCEEIDVGEDGTVRLFPAATIHGTKDMEGRLVLVLCNPEGTQLG
jgi:tRNA-binding EMAP/Myf-like protein